jgi:hypothetical protein
MLTADYALAGYPTQTTLESLTKLAASKGHRVVKVTYGGGTQIEVRATGTRYDGAKFMRRVQCYKVA